MRVCSDLIHYPGGLYMTNVLAAAQIGGRRTQGKWNFEQNNYRWWSWNCVSEDADTRRSSTNFLDYSECLDDAKKNGWVPRVRKAPDAEPGRRSGGPDRRGKKRSELLSSILMS